MRRRLKPLLLLPFVLSAGCGRSYSPPDLAALAGTLQCQIPADAQLLFSDASDGGSVWLVRTGNRLTPSAAAEETPIPSEVLLGLLEQFASSELATAGKPTSGFIREWTAPPIMIRLREFQTPAGWYAMVERFDIERNP